MPSHDFINVRLTVDRSPVIEYPAPGDGHERDRTLLRYIEARQDQQFAVRITLQPGFDFQGADYVYYRFALDDSLNYSFHEFPRYNASHSNGVLLNEMRGLGYKIQLKDDVSGVWKHYNYGSGAMGMNDSAATATLNQNQLENIGSIRVTVYRANRNIRATQKVSGGKMPQVLDEISEKSHKGKAIQNNIKYANGIPFGPPSLLKYSYHPILGDAGKPYQFNFRYRSKKILQSLRCIPRSPSPPPDLNLMLKRTEVMLKLSKQQERETHLELLRVRAALEQERRRNRSTSGQDNTISSFSTMAISPSRPTQGRDSSVKKETNTYQIDLTNPFAKRETGTNSPGLSATFLPPQSSRPRPPLLGTPTRLIKRRDEEEDDESGSSGNAATGAQATEATEEANLTSAGLNPQKPSSEKGEKGKRKRSENGNEADNDVLGDLPHSPKQPRISDIIDLTDD